MVTDIQLDKKKPWLVTARVTVAHWKRIHSQLFMNIQIEEQAFKSFQMSREKILSELNWNHSTWESRN